jgi:dihydrofolate reductase
MISYYEAQSKDGYIAGTQGSLEFLEYAKKNEGEDYGFHEFFASVEICVMGSSTWEMIKDFGEWPYSGKESWVITSKRDREALADERFAAFEPEFWKSLSQRKNIWLVGGGVLAQSFYDAGLIDRLIVTTLPQDLGAGIAMFAGGFDPARWRLSQSKTFALDITQNTYSKI